MGVTFVSYAQNAEDLMLWRALRHVERGFWIDAGAADPDEMSVTRAFHDRGWTGINVEPGAHYFDRLRDSRPGDINLRVALGAQDGSRPFHLVADTGLSTLDAELARTHARAGFTVTAGTVEVCTLAAICRWHAPGPIHFLKVDVEGAEAEVLAGADWQRFRPWIVLVEATVPLTDQPTEAQWEPTLLDAGYVFVWFDGLNRFYVAREHHHALAPAFARPPNHADDWVLAADHRDRQRLRDLQAELALARREVGRALLEIEQRRVDAAAALAGRDDARRERDAAVAETAWLRRSLDALDQPPPPPTPPPPTPPPPTPATPKPANPEPSRGTAPALPARRRPAARLALPLWRLVRPVARPLAWRLRGFLTAELLAGLRELQHRPARPGEPDNFDRHRGSSAEPLRLPPPALAAQPAAARPPASLRTVHQFHPSVAPGDAITNGLLLTRDLLRSLGFASDIFSRHTNGLAPDLVRPLADLPTHADYVLMVHHSLGDPEADAVAAFPAPKVLVFHNITPPALLDDPGLQALSELGREQLDWWRPRVAAALGVSETNSIELRRRGFPAVLTAALLFDTDRLERDAARARARNRDRRAPADPSRPFTVLFVGRIVASKGQADLVDAFAAFRAASDDRPSRLVLVGRVFGGAEPYEREIRRRIERHGLGATVLLTGGVDDDTLHDWYARADVYASMSRHEGFGVPLVEAMAHGLPVAALAAGAVPLTLGGAGLLVSGGPDAMAAALGRIASGQAPDTEAARAARLDSLRLERQVPPLLEALATAGALRPAPAADPAALARALSLTVAGHVRGSYSLAAVNRALALSLDRAAPGRVALHPVEGEPVPLGDTDDAASLQPLVRRDRDDPDTQAVISQHYPVWVPPSRPGQLRLAYVFWEESLLPDATADTLNAAFDAVLAPSRAVGRALVDSGVRVPVRVVGFAPPLDRFRRLADRPERDGDRPFTLLHVSSGFPRKGVDILLDAYARAFGPDERVRLVVKTFPNPHNDVAARIDALRARHPGCCDIVHLDADLSPDELDTLYLGADAVVLPSRGEGFLLPAAEAMAAGVPLVVSAVGGHRDFVPPDAALFVDGRLDPSRSHLATPGSLWFEPDPDALRNALRAVLDDRDAARGRARLARLAADDALGGERFATGVIDTVAALLAAPAPRPAPSRIALLTSWGVRCGVAEYSAMLAGALPLGGASLAILADDRSPPQDGHPIVRPAWHTGTAFDPDATAGAIGRHDPDILLVQHQPGLFGWQSLARLLEDRRVHGRTLAVTLHNTRDLDALDQAERTRLVRSLALADRLIVHAPADGDRLRHLGLDAAIIAQGTPATAARPRPARALLARDAPVLGAYGFLLPPKNFGSLIEALPILRRTWPKATLRMVTALYDQGPSETEHHRLRKLAHDIGVGGEIDWHTGFLPTGTSLELLRGCDLLVLPYEPTPEASSAALRTALASLVPTAVTPIDIFREAGSAVGSLPGSTPELIAAGVTSLLQSPDERRALADRQAGWLADRSWDVIGRRTMRLLEALYGQAS